MAFDPASKNTVWYRRDTKKREFYRCMIKEKGRNIAVIQMDKLSFIKFRTFDARFFETLAEAQKMFIENQKIMSKELYKKIVKLYKMKTDASTRKYYKNINTIMDLSDSSDDVDSSSDPEYLPPIKAKKRNNNKNKKPSSKKTRLTSSNSSNSSNSSSRKKPNSSSKKVSGKKRNRIEFEVTPPPPQSFINNQKYKTGDNQYKAQHHIWVYASSGQDKIVLPKKYQQAKITLNTHRLSSAQFLQCSENKMVHLIFNQHSIKFNYFFNLDRGIMDKIVFQDHKKKLSIWGQQNISMMFYCGDKNIRKNNKIHPFKDLAHKILQATSEIRLEKCNGVKVVMILSINPKNSRMILLTPSGKWTEHTADEIGDEELIKNYNEYKQKSVMKQVQALIKMRTGDGYRVCDKCNQETTKMKVCMWCEPIYEIGQIYRELGSPKKKKSRIND